MTVLKHAHAGTLESSDVFVEVSPREGGNEINIESVVINQFGEALREAVESMLDEYGLSGVCVSLKDRGALDCTVKARVETALRRAGMEVPKHA